MEWTLDERSEGQRLDVFLAECAGVTRSRAASIIKSGGALVDGKPETKAGFTLKRGMCVYFEIPEVQPATAVAQDIALDIRYQDQDLAVIYKPSGMVVHPAAGNHDGTMVNALLHHLTDLSGIGGELRPGIVHRIDKDTSGLLLVAKNDFSHQALSEQIKAHTVERAYLAIVYGALKQDSGFVDGPIGRHPSDRKRMAIVSGGRNAHTDWTVLQRLKGATLIEARLTTGRTHQIRVHMASIGHPVVGDPVYGPKKPGIDVPGGQLLHAFRIGFTHPTTGERMLFEAPPEKRFSDMLEKLSI
jgi:23S rRNA pseudouridine1911/1915/1917 synthase